MEDENANLKFLNSQYLQKIQNLEKLQDWSSSSTMQATEKVLQAEIVRPKKKVAPHGASSPKSTEHLPRLVQILEAQRDFFKEEYEYLRRLQEANMVPKVSGKPQKKSSSGTKLTAGKSQASQVSRERNFLRLVEEERDIYKGKYTKLVEKQKASSEDEKEDLPVATADKEIMVIDNTLDELKKENFELLQRVKELEHQIHQKASEKEPEESGKQRTERENLEKALRQLVNKIEELQSEVKKISEEKQFFMQKYQQAVIENSQLQDTKVVSVLDNRNTIKSMLPRTEDQVPIIIYTDDDVQEKIKLMREGDSYRESLESHKIVVSSLEDQVSSLRSQLAQAVDELDQHRTAAEQIRLMADHGKRSSEQLHLLLTHKQEELDYAERKIASLESGIEELKDILKHHEKEITDLRSTAVGLEHDKEKHRETLSEKHIHLSSRQQQIYSKLNAKELESKLKELNEVKNKVSTYITEVSRLQELLSIKEQQRSELIQQYQDLSEQNTHLEIETRRLQSEASAVQGEVLAKDVELQNLRSTICSLEQEVEEYFSAQEANKLEMIFLNSSVLGLEAELQQKQQENRRLQAELLAARTLSVQIDASREQLQKMLADEGTNNAKV